MSLPLAADTAVVDVSDPSFTRVELALLADHGASIERGPFVGPPASHTADLRVEIVNLDATYSHVDWVTGSSRRSFLRPLSEPGEHNLTIQNDSPQAATIGVNTALRYWYKGRPAAIGICEPEDEKLIALPKDLTTGWSGRLVEAFVCGAMQVYPAGGKGRSPVQENRNLDYTEDAYDDSAWVPVNVLGGVGLARVLYYEISPFIRLFADSPDDLARDFPDPYAALVAPPGATLLRARPLPLDSGMDFYIRWRVTIPDTGSYDGYILGDDSLELAIDGVPQARAGTGSMVQASFSVDLTAGEHLFTMHVNNKRNAEIAWSLNPGGQFNPSFGTWSLFRSGFRNAEGFVAHADGTGKVLVSDRVPGMTYGRAIRLLVDEAVARGCVAPALGFTDGADSDGVPWEYGVVSTRIMNDVHSVLKEQSVANIDFSIRTGAFVLDMWNFAGKGIDAPVPFRAKTDMTPATMTTLTRKGGGPVTNAFLARTAYGWDEVVRDSSIADFGRQEAGYSLGAANSPADVSTTANGRLDIVSVPRYQYEAVHNTTNDDEWAFNGYDLGDRVPLTPPGESTTLERVVSIAVAEGDDTGRAIETVSLRDIVYYASPIEHFVGLLGQWAKKMIPGTGRGSWPETQPVTSPTVPAPVVRWESGAEPPYFCDADGPFTESFATGDSTTLGPDLTWEKLDTTDPSIDVGPDDGEVHSDAFGVYGGSGSAPPGPGNSFTVYGKSLARADADVNCPGMYAETIIAAMDPDYADPTHGRLWTVFLGVNLGDEADADPSGGFGLAYGLLRWVGIYVGLQFNQGGGLDNYTFYEITESGGFCATPGGGSGSGIVAVPGDVFRLRHICTPTATNIQLFYNGVAHGGAVSAEQPFDDYVGRTRGAIGSHLGSFGSVDVRRLYRLGPFGVGGA